MGVGDTRTLRFLPEMALWLYFFLFIEPCVNYPTNVLDAVTWSASIAWLSLLECTVVVLCSTPRVKFGIPPSDNRCRFCVTHCPQSVARGSRFRGAAGAACVSPAGLSQITPLLQYDNLPYCFVWAAWRFLTASVPGTVQTTGDKSRL